MDWNKECVGNAPSRKESPSARKVWIEIWLWEAYKTAAMRRLPQGRCGLKYTNKKLVNLTRGHLPQGRCGLKWTCIVQTPRDLTSPSARKVWIEISQYVLSLVYHPVAFRKEGVDWNNSFAERPNKSIASPSARKVWIEIHWMEALFSEVKGRLPQGRCGLKYIV